MMFEILNNGRYFLYQREDGSRFTDSVLPRFAKIESKPYILSVYLDVDRKNRRLMIKDPIT